MEYTKKFSEMTSADVTDIGGKGASLIVLLQAGVPVPGGFFITTKVFDSFLETAGLALFCNEQIESIVAGDSKTIKATAKALQEKILSAQLPSNMVEEITMRVAALNVDRVAVRSSATVEDGEESSWAGQLDTFLCVSELDVVAMVRRCWASLFSSRALSYRIENGLQNKAISMAVVIQPMIAADKAGVVFTQHPISGTSDVMVIEAVYGLGEGLVSGELNPDSYTVHKKSRQIIERITPTKTKALRKSNLSDNGEYVAWHSVAEVEGKAAVLTDDEIKQLTEQALSIEELFGHSCDIEWVFSGEQLYITQSRPVTTKVESTEALTNEPHFFDKQISLTEWLSNLGHEKTAAHREEDNQKRERLAVLNDIIGIPFDRPVQFTLTAVVERTPDFISYFEQHKNNKCALRLIPTNSDLPKLRMRGMTVGEVVQEWLPQQEADPAFYRVDFVPHADTNYWSTIFVVNEGGVRGEIIADTHEKLTQGYFEDVEPITFTYDLEDKKWTLAPYDEGAKLHLMTLIEHLRVSPKEQETIQVELQGTFTKGYLQGYFETVDTDQGLWFIDYNRLLHEELPAQTSAVQKDSLVTGRCASPGDYKGVVEVVTDPAQCDFTPGAVLVCDMTSPLFLPLMQQAGAIVTNRGGITCHAAIVARELKKPCIVGTKNATEILKTGMEVEVNAGGGWVR